MELKLKLKPQTTKPQVSFLPELGTQVHILRLIGKIIDVQAEPKFDWKNWSTLFVDFESTFNKIDYLILP